MQSLRVIAGFLVAPLIPGLVIAALPGPGPPNWPLLARLTAGAIIVAPYAYVVTLVFGIPAFLIYRRFQLVRFAHYVVGGFFGSMAVFWIIGMFVHEAKPWQLLWPGTRFG